MSRIGATGSIERAPENNIYTALAAAACVALALAFWVLYSRSQEIMGGLL